MNAATISALSAAIVAVVGSVSALVGVLRHVKGPAHKPPQNPST